MNKITYKLLFIFLYSLISSLTTFAQNSADECEDLFKQGQQAVNQQKYLEALEYFTRAEILAEKHNLYEKRYFAKNYIGIIYYNLYDYSEALNYYWEAYTFALKHLGPVQEMATLNNIAILYGDDGQYEKSKEYLFKAYNIAKKENDSLKIGHYAINLGILSSRANDYVEGKKFLYEALKYIDDSEVQLNLRAWSTLSEIYISLQEYDAAKKIIDRIYNDAKQLPEKDIYVIILLHLSEYYYYKQDFDKSIEMCQKIMDNSSWEKD